MRILGRSIKILVALPVFFRNISIASLIIVAVLLFAESVIRNLWGFSIVAADEVAGAGMVLFIFLALAWVYQQEGHLRMSVLVDHLPKTERHILELFYSILSLLFVTFIAYLWWDMAFSAFQSGKYTKMMGIVEWPFQMAAVVGWGIFLIVILERAVGQVKQIFGRFPTDKRA